MRRPSCGDHRAETIAAALLATVVAASPLCWRRRRQGTFASETFATATSSAGAGTTTVATAAITAAITASTVASTLTTTSGTAAAVAAAIATVTTYAPCGDLATETAATALAATTDAAALA